MLLVSLFTATSFIPHILLKFVFNFAESSSSGPFFFKREFLDSRFSELLNFWHLFFLSHLDDCLGIEYYGA